MTVDLNFPTNLRKVFLFFFLEKAFQLFKKLCHLSKPRIFCVLLTEICNSVLLTFTPGPNVLTAEINDTSGDAHPQFFNC